MASYTFIFMSAGVELRRIEEKFQDDLDALDTAAVLSEQYAIDLWAGDRLVAHFKKGNAPFTVRDAYPG